jgi:hypothetical protein
MIKRYILSELFTQSKEDDLDWQNQLKLVQTGKNALELPAIASETQREI